eukprot:9153777-Pyramimonas_sp.AAC.1
MPIQFGLALLLPVCGAPRRYGQCRLAPTPSARGPSTWAQYVALLGSTDSLLQYVGPVARGLGSGAQPPEPNWREGSGAISALRLSLKRINWSM